MSRDAKGAVAWAAPGWERGIAARASGQSSNGLTGGFYHA